MINLGSDIIFLSGKLTPPFRRALRHFRQNLLSGAVASTASGTNSIVAEALMRAEASSKLDEETVATLFRLANDQVLTGAEKKRAFVALGFEGLPPAHLVTLFRRAARLAIFNLWAQRAVILPIGSHRAWSVEHALLRNIAPPTASFCLNYGEKPLATIERMPAKSLEQRMRYRVVPWLPATDWTSPEYISESDIVALRVFERQGEGTDRQYLRSVAVAIDEIQRNFPDTCRVDRDSIDRINQYILGGYFKEVSFQDLDKAVEKRKIDKIDRIKKNNKIKYAKNASKRQESRASKSDDPDNLMYLNTERMGWFQDLSAVSFLPVKIDSKSIDIWSKLFDTVIAHRRRDYETDEGLKIGIRALADYLSICLPVHFSNQRDLAEWESDASVRSTIPIPSKPGEFTRYPFVKGDDADLLRAPTILEFIAGKGIAISTQKVVITALWQVFDFVQQNLADDRYSLYAGKDFLNPISKGIDLPRNKGRPQKSTKIPLKKRHFFHVRSWMYAVLAFGEYLQSEDDAAEKIRSIIKNGATLATADFGYIPFYTFEGKNWPVTHISTKILQTLPGGSDVMLSVTRMLMLTLETGIRMQSSQWLCRLQYRRHCNDNRNDPATLLYVNTDKVQGPFVIPVMWRVMDMLDKEREDQEMASADFVEVDYEGREDSRFDSLVPLFKSGSSDYPYRDETYRLTWIAILSCIEDHHGECLDGSALTHRSGKGGRNRRAISTPHALRTTFVSARSALLDLEDIKDLVGHTNKEATRYYDKVDPEALALKLAYAETDLPHQGATWSGPRVSSGPAFIQAADRNSALQKSFHADRNAAIAKFGVVALVTGRLDQSLKQSGLDLLRTAAAGSLSFRDTHICPVNEECPEFVVAQFGRARACGQCPLGCKSIDHLPAISAKMHKLLRVYADDLRRLREAENSGRDNAAAELYDSLLFTVNEFLGWKITEHVLLENVKQSVGRGYVIGDPDFVREHLVRNVGESTAQ